jgi:hypothetical protein
MTIALRRPSLSNLLIAIAEQVSAYSHFVNHIAAQHRQWVRSYLTDLIHAALT